MTSSVESAAWYDAHAAELARSYEAVDPNCLHGWFVDLLPPVPALALDVGAGSGRDAAWLAGKGYAVVAVEPSAAMRAEAGARHASAGVAWIADELPALAEIYGRGLAFNLMLLSGVWQHVRPMERECAMDRLLGLLRPGGVLALSLRHGPSEDGRSMHPVSLPEVQRLASERDACVVRTTRLADQQRREGVSWTGVVLRLRDYTSV